MCLADTIMVNCITIEPYADAQGALMQVPSTNFTIRKYDNSSHVLEVLKRLIAVEHAGKLIAKVISIGADNSEGTNLTFARFQRERPPNA